MVYLHTSPIRSHSPRKKTVTVTSHELPPPRYRRAYEPHRRHSSTRLIFIFLPIFVLVIVGLALAAALPVRERQRPQGNRPAISTNFQDPTILQVGNTWYTYAGASNDSGGLNVLIATSTDFANFEVRDGYDALPDAGSWTVSPPHVWAPDVTRLNENTYVMHYSAIVAAEPRFHCIGAATANNPMGPFTPQSTPLFCNTSAGGAIDSDCFHDPKTDKQYIVYKVDGNGMGNGGLCYNAVDPIAPTPLMLQEVSAEDGFTLIGEPHELLTNEPSDGANVEAPALTYHRETDTYVLFFNSRCFTTQNYTILYATSQGNVTGPYTRHDDDDPFLKTGDTAANVAAPGAIDLSVDGKRAIFQGDLNRDWFRDTSTKRVRGMYTVEVEYLLTADGGELERVKPGRLLS